MGTVEQMEILIRDMQPDEVKEAVALAKKSFGLIEGLFVPAPKLALVALSGGKVVGGIFYSVKISDGKTFGFIDYVFTDPALQGQGIGRRLCEACFDALWKLGCDALLTFVQDDNVSSWRLFVTNGFVRSSLPKMVKRFGLLSALKAKLLFSTFGLCVGYDFYLALPDKGEIRAYEKEESNPRQILAYILINLLFAAGIILTASARLTALAAFVYVFLGCVLAGYIGTLFSKQTWHFRLTGGGALISLAAAIVQFWPMNGGWYPQNYENSATFKRDMAFNSIVVWLFLLFLSASRLLITEAAPLVTGIWSIATVLLVIRCIPLSPISSYGAGRVLRWNKTVYGILAGLSILVAFVIPLAMALFS